MTRAMTLAAKAFVVFLSENLPGAPELLAPDCVALKVNAKVRGEAGEGIVVGARCSPSNQITQYWVQKANGERFWASLQELKTR
jgi:hypothetical protein